MPAQDARIVQDSECSDSEDNDVKELSDISYEDNLKKPPPRLCRKRVMCLGGSIVLVLALIAAVQFVSYQYMAVEFVKIRTDYAASLNTTPADALTMFEKEHAEDWVCGRNFYTFGDTARRASKYFADNGWLDVSFPSRHHDGIPDITVRAFFFKSQRPGMPTIIVQHGNNVNNRDHTVIAAAYFLSSMGYNVLAPNLRNHGDSGKTPRGRITWAQQEAYDVLGAWDYVVNDPDGKLGGPQQPSRTALYGFSMGGLICRVAFALEPRIPALLTDSAVWNAKQVLEYHINYAVPGWGWFFVPSAWFWCKRLDGYDLDKLIPEKLLAVSGDTRIIGATHASDDDTVQFQQSKAFHKFIKQTDYRVPVEWYEKVDNVAGECGTHCTMHLRWPWKYRHFLCQFFSNVFTEPAEECIDPRLRHPTAAGMGEDVQARRLAAAAAVPQSGLV